MLFFDMLKYAFLKVIQSITQRDKTKMLKKILSDKT